MKQSDQELLSRAKNHFKYKKFRKVWFKNYGNSYDQKSKVAWISKDGKFNVNGGVDLNSKNGLQIWNQEIKNKKLKILKKKVNSNSNKTNKKQKSLKQ